MKKFASELVKKGLPIRTSKSTSRDTSRRERKGTVYESLDSWSDTPRKELDPHLDARGMQSTGKVAKSKRREYPVTVAFNESEFNLLNAYVKDLRCSRAAFIRTAIFVAMGKNPNED
jgi:hypothetical protein